ncbi:hypothetical protein NQ314_017405 [Rhamnusium bicolor]|uniref:U3 small nucleolar RNA-associated protein 13 C-terminal domain-containing protein n=1 Tax=Rhamnusium bicolor TaxID=1586634 RepID=A0AAV8WTT8_9CUCU|nr:hypothetical protein NQ314_017405 [Rhamnusium bicolor]
MTNKIKLKESFDVESKHGAFYTGGNVEWLEDTLYCQTNSNISLLNVENGLVEKTVGQENSEDADFIQTFTTDGQRIISSHKSGLLKMWNESGEIEKMWKYIHKGPIAKLALNENKLASGGSDGIVRIWDLQFQSCLLSLRGCQGVINVVVFDPVRNLIFVSGDDGKINCFDLENGNLTFIYDAHFSKVTSVVFCHDSKHFVSSGRDKVIILWELNTTTALRTIPTYEAVEVIVSLPSKFKLPGFKADPESVYVASAGEKGIVKVWDVRKAKEVFVQSNSFVSPSSEEGGLAITNLLFNKKSKALAVVSTEHNLIIHHLKSFACLKQFIGFSDEILDVSFVGKNDTFLAVATNSNDIKLYDNATMNCQLLKGHTDLVLSLNTSKTNADLLLSSGKDNTIRLWLLEGSTMSCIGIGMRHTGSVGSVSFSQTSTNFAVSVSQDTCLKLWEIPSNREKNASLNCNFTEVAHQKDINCVTVSPNDKIIATASQDKTAKLWTDSLTLVGILRGHKRGVWSIRFSPIDQVVVTSSADCTVKLWSVADLNCLKTLEGHESSVLKAEFLSVGMQILSAGADGLLKLFSIKSSECVSTLDQHEARIWALAIKRDESGIVTGGSDSVLIKWKDMTEELKMKRQKEAEELALQEQKLSNYIHNDELLKALKLALKLDRPVQVLRIIQGVIKKGDTGLADTIRALRNDQKESLLKCATNWNMNSKNCQPAQLVLNILLNELQTGEFRPVGLSSSIEGALPYTERHFKRLTQLLQDLQFINYTVNCMQPHAKSVD